MPNPMKEAHASELTQALEYFVSDEAAAELCSALKCIAGRERPLRIPTGADFTFRENLARYFAQIVERRMADETDQFFLAHEVCSERWVCPADRPILPLDSMKFMAIHRLKKPLRHCAFSPAFRLRKKPDRPVELVPYVRLFAIVSSSEIERIERSVNLICRDLDPHGSNTTRGASIRPVAPGTVAEQFARMLTLGSGYARPTPDAGPTSKSVSTGALLRLSLAATIPLKGVIVANGTMKVDLRLALTQAKAAAVARHADCPSPIAQSEVYPALGDMMPTINGRQARLPFCIE